LIAEKDDGKKLKYKRKANRNRCVSKFRERFIRILLFDPGNYGRLLDDLIADVAKYPIPVVTGRSPLRKTPRNKRFFQSRRSVV
jgi:hypothetical protein